MFTILLLTAIDGWGYEGFASEPGPVPQTRTTPETKPAAPPAPPAVPPPVVPPPPPATTETPKAKPSAKAVAPPPPRAAAPPVVPQYRLADATGQVWQHADADWLRRWVASRNAAVRPVTTYAGPRATAPACANGRCPRR